MADIDDIDAIRSLDNSDMLWSIINFPGQIDESVDIGYDADISGLDAESINNIVIAGMGGSAIGGDLLRGYLSTLPVPPIYIHRDYDLPGFVGRDSLVVALSYSGNTEETLSAFDRAVEIGAQIICIGSGGKLPENAGKHSMPCIRIPGGLMPRAALGYLFVPLLIVISRLGFCRIEKDDLIKLSDFMRSNVHGYSPETPMEKNPAKQLAEGIRNRLPIIYAADRFFGPVARRFKAQLCENAKTLAFCNTFPEFNHNELVGFENPPISAGDIIVVVFSDIDDNRRVKSRMKIVTDFLNYRGVEVLKIESDGSNLLERMFSVIQLGDFASFYLAVLNDCDPSVIEPIEYLKQELAKIRED